MGRLGPGYEEGRGLGLCLLQKHVKNDIFLCHCMLCFYRSKTKLTSFRSGLMSSLWTTKQNVELVKIFLSTNLLLTISQIKIRQ